MGVHEEELLWLAERVRHIKASSGGSTGGTVRLGVEPALGEQHQMHVQITGEANGVKLNRGAGS